MKDFFLAHPLYCGRFTLELDRPAVMGIVNLTPDSFAGDGVAGDVAAAIARAEAQIEAGADLIDLGAESSRPGATPLPLADELARLLPVLHALRDQPLPLSVDTYKPEVMRAALDAGASVINDIFAFRQPGAWSAVAAADCALCCMHMRGAPRDMQAAPHYDDVVGEVETFFAERLLAADQAGVARQRCWLDPGFGFGKTLEHNLALFRQLPRFLGFGRPLLVGVSRKSMLGALTGRAVDRRMPASIVAAVAAARTGASVLRVHDVAETIDALTVAAALSGDVF